MPRARRPSPPATPRNESKKRKADNDEEVYVRKTKADFDKIHDVEPLEDLRKRRKLAEEEQKAEQDKQIREAIPTAQSSSPPSVAEIAASIMAKVLNCLGKRNVDKILDKTQEAVEVAKRTCLRVGGSFIEIGHSVDKALYRKFGDLSPEALQLQSTYVAAVECRTPGSFTPDTFRDVSSPAYHGEIQKSASAIEVQGASSVTQRESSATSVAWSIESDSPATQCAPELVIIGPPRLAARAKSPPYTPRRPLAYGLPPQPIDNLVRQRCAKRPIYPAGTKRATTTDTYNPSTYSAGSKVMDIAQMSQILTSKLDSGQSVNSGEYRKLEETFNRRLNARYQVVQPVQSKKSPLPVDGSSEDSVNKKGKTNKQDKGGCNDNELASNQEQDSDGDDDSASGPKRTVRPPMNLNATTAAPSNASKSTEATGNASTQKSSSVQHIAVVTTFVPEASPSTAKAPPTTPVSAPVAQTTATPATNTNPFFQFDKLYRASDFFKPATSASSPQGRPPSRNATAQAGSSSVQDIASASLSLPPTVSPSPEAASSMSATGLKKQVSAKTPSTPAATGQSIGRIVFRRIVDKEGNTVEGDFFEPDTPSDPQIPASLSPISSHNSSIFSQPSNVPTSPATTSGNCSDDEEQNEMDGYTKTGPAKVVESPVVIEKLIRIKEMVVEYEDGTSETESERQLREEINAKEERLEELKIESHETHQQK